MTTLFGPPCARGSGGGAPVHRHGSRAAGQPRSPFKAPNVGVRGPQQRQRSRGHVNGERASPQFVDLENLNERIQEMDHQIRYSIVVASTTSERVARLHEQVARLSES